MPAPVDKNAAVQFPLNAVRSVSLTASADVVDVTDGIMVDTDGVYALKFRDDASAVNRTLKAGLVYPFRIYALGACAGIVAGLYTK